MSLSSLAPTVSSSASRSDTQRLYALLGFCLVVLFPTGFWLGVAELFAFTFDISYGLLARALIGTLLFGLLTFIWAIMLGTGSEQR